MPLPTIVRRFLIDIFDDEELYLEAFIKDDELDMDAVMAHPALQLNIYYGVVWNAIYSTFPSKYDFRDFMIRNRHKMQHDNNTILQDMLLLQLVPFDMNALLQKIKAGSHLMHDKEFLRTMILRKWHYRFYPYFPDPETTALTEPLIHIYVKHIKAVNAIESTEAPFTNISGNIDFEPNFKLEFGTASEQLQYMIHKDVHFCKRLATEGLVIVDSSNTDETYQHHLAIVKDALNITLEVSLDACKEIVQFIPKIAKVFINMTETSLPDFSPNLSFQYKDNILPFFTYDDVDMTKAILARYVKNTREQYYIDFVNKIFATNKDKIKSLQCDFDSAPKDNVVVLVDNRENAFSVISMILAALNVDNTKWDFMIFTSSKAVKYYVDRVGRFAKVVPYDALDVKVFNIDVYNGILMSQSFWSRLQNWSKVLIIQDDGVVIRKGVEKFLEWDYIGAPWLDAPGNEYLKQKVNPNMVGNGGLSLRSIKSMMDVVKNCEQEKNQLFYYNINRIPEDVYFVKALCSEERKDIYKLPLLTVGAQFSSEQIVNMNSIGFHKLWMYNSQDIVKQYFDKALLENMV